MILCIDLPTITTTSGGVNWLYAAAVADTSHRAAELVRCWWREHFIDTLQSGTDAVFPADAEPRRGRS